MARVRFLPKAIDDLADVWRYTVDRWSVEQAVRYLDGLDTAINRLADAPLICREREELEPPVRILHHASHLIVYFTTEDGIVVIRVLHENMDVEQHLDNK